MNRSSLGISDKLVYALIYLLPVVGSVLFLIVDFREREIRLHALQMLLLAAVVTAAHIVLGLFALIPFIGRFFDVVIWLLYGIYVLLALFALLRALSGNILRLPLLYDLAYSGAYGR